MSKRKKLILLLVAIILITAAVPLTAIIASSNGTNPNSLILQTSLTSQLAQVGTTQDGNTPNDAWNTPDKAIFTAPGIYPGGYLNWPSNLPDYTGSFPIIPFDGDTPEEDAGDTPENATVVTPGTYSNTIDWNSDPFDYYNVSVPGVGYTIYASIDCQLTNGSFPGGLIFTLLDPDGMIVAAFLEWNTNLRRGLLYTLNSTDKTGYWTIGVHAPSTEYYTGMDIWVDMYSVGSYILRVNASASQTMTKPQAQWTFMSYMVAEDSRGYNGMGQFSMNDIAEMAGVGSTDSVNIVALVDPYAGGDYPYTNQSGTRAYYVDREGVVWLSDFGDAEKDTGDYATLRDFISFVKAHFPAQHYALNLWDHGAGISGVCFDGTSGNDNLKFKEIFKALNDTGGVDLLHYKACLTGVIEGLYSVANLTDVIVASEDVTMDTSLIGQMDFYPFLNNLSSTPSASAAQLGQWIVDAYSSSKPPYLSFAVVNSSEIANVYAALNETVKYLDIQTLNSTWRTTIIQTLNQVENFSYYFPYDGTGFGYFLVDLYDFADKLAQNLNDPQLTALTNNLKIAIQDAVIYVAHGTDPSNETDHPNAHGIAIYHPNTEGNYSGSKDYYTSLSFTKSNMWDEYLWHLLGYYTEHDKLDYDSDGLTNTQEYSLGTNAFNPDTDSDGMPDGWEVANGLNPLTNDANQDPDSDGLTNLMEYLAGTNPNSSDTDSDGMPDVWEVANGLNPLVNDSSEDPDSDNLTNVEEYQQGTNPNSSDTDGDGMPDGWEVANLLNPHGDDANLDSDSDGLTNLQEYQQGTNPNSSDTDSDGMPDGWEVANGFNPLADDSSEDPDSDNLTNVNECKQGTNPHNNDTEDDGMPDGWEVQYGLDPLSNDADQDKDGDWFTNLQEYLAGTDPTDPNSHPSTFSLSGIMAIMMVSLSLSAQQQNQGRNIVIISIAAIAAVVGTAVVLKIMKVF